MGSLKYVHNRKSVEHIKQMFKLDQLNEEINDILKKDTELGLKMAQKLTKESYDKLKAQQFKLEVHINSPEVVIGLRNSRRALVFLPGQLTVNNFLGKEDPNRLRRYNINLQKTSLMFSRNKRFVHSDWLDILRLEPAEVDCNGGTKQT